MVKIISTVKMIIAIFLSPFLRRIKPNIWIIGERKDQARDNGYCFFKYTRTNHLECNTYYIISRESNDSKKLQKFGNILFYNTFKHYLYFAAAEVQISSHANVYWPDDVVPFRWIRNQIKIKKVFLPHGVSYGYTEWATKKYAKFDLFLCSGAMEYENVLRLYGYSENQVAYTGIPRLDLWHDPISVNQKQVVLMPTWRMCFKYTDCVFDNSNYYKMYQRFLNNSDLIRFLVENNIKIVFYLHHEMQKFSSAFSTSCPNIEIVSQDNENQYDIQELLRRSALLITDYSSVHFDFAYMNKPVIYYQFDQAEFYQNQYNQTWFSAEKNGFGPVVYDDTQLVREVIRAYNNRMKVEIKYHERMRSFYRLYDNKNSERVFHTIKKKAENEW